MTACLEDSLLILPTDFRADAPEYTPLDTNLIVSVEIPQVEESVDTVVAVDEPPAWLNGIEPQMRVMQPANNSGFLMVIALMFVVLIFNFRHLSRLAKTYFEEVWKLRAGRDNVFDERPAGDTRILILLLIQAVVCSGILLASGISLFDSAGTYTPLNIARVGAVTAVLAVYYIVLWCAYNVVGYTFATPERHHDWVRSFNASQALLGMALVIPAILAIFYPALAYNVVLIGLAIYLIARLLFIFKGFRIFYTNFGSIVYFILYLCTLEIIPILLVYKSSQVLVNGTL